MTYDEHIARLLKTHKIYECRVQKIEEARATIGTWKVVHIPKVEDSLTYLVALHEIGHILTHRNNAGKLVRESRAWEWALDNIECEITEDAWRAAHKSLSSYISQVMFAVRKGWQDMYEGCNLPGKDSIVWTIAALLRGFATGYTVHPREARKVYELEVTA